MSEEYLTAPGGMPGVIVPPPAKLDRVSLVKPGFIAQWWGVMFRYGQFVAKDHQIELRKIGSHDGEIFQESQSYQPWIEEDPDLAAVQWMLKRIETAAEAGVGAFMAPAILNDRRATDESVKYLVGVTVDLDTGDTIAKMQKLISMGLRPTMIVASGGTTMEGQPKLHLHYRLDEPCDEPWKVAHVREVLAHKVGGDGSFKRIPQVVRIPGSVYDKAGCEARTVSIVECYDELEYGLGKFAEVLDIDFEAIPDIFMWSDAQQGVHGRKDPERQAERFREISSTIIHEGGTTDTRFARITELAGRYIYDARCGRCTVEEALAMLHSFNETNVSPPFLPGRVTREFRALLALDRKNHAEAWAAQEITAAPVEVTSTAEPSEWSWAKFKAKDLFVGEPPPIEWVVDQFLIENNAHALVADGGVGKTYMALDLAMRVAIGARPGNSYLGFPVSKTAVSIMLTVEDSLGDIHRRVRSIDPRGELLAQTEGRFYVLPVKDEIKGGLTLMEKDARGNYKPSKAWEFLVSKIAQVREEHGADVPLVVIIDTYSATHHADENTSVGTNEWFRAASLLHTQYQAALVVTHHIRKADPNIEIKTVSDFRALVRGSGAFMNNCRTVFGVWEMPNQGKLKKEAGAEQEAVLFNFGILKTNTAIDWSHRSNPKFPEPIITLRRRGDGALIYDGTIHEVRLSMGDRAKKKQAAAVVQLKAAVLKAVELYAKAGYPLVGRNLTHEFVEHLPAEVHQVPNARRLIEAMVPELVAARKLVKVEAKVRGRSLPVLDIPTGPYASGAEQNKSGVAPTIDWSNHSYDTEREAYK